MEFKSHLASAVAPDVVFCFQTEEVPSFCTALGDALSAFRQERIDSNEATKIRNSEKRRRLRELGYAKYFEDAKVKVYALNHLILEDKEGKNIILHHKAEDLLVGLHDKQKRFLGLGVIRAVNYNRKSLKVFTSVRKKPAILSFGKLRLDWALRELPQRTQRSEFID